MRITRELVEKTADENIPRKEYNAILAAISLKADEIWRYILDQSGRNLGWYAFENDVSYGRGNGSSGGNFDYNNDKDFIEFVGEYSSFGDVSDFYQYESGFPTRFLWEEDYQSEVINHITEAKALAEAAFLARKAKKQEKKDRQKTIRASIESKLTKEELSFITWK